MRLGRLRVDVNGNPSTTWPAWADQPWRTEMQEALDQALEAAGPGDPDVARRRRISLLLTELADRAWDQQHAYSRGRLTWRWVSYVLGGMSVVASAVGGSILVTNQLSGTARWIVGSASLVAGAVGGLTALLSPAEEWQTARLKSKLFEAFWREAWHYAVVRLPSATPDSAAVELEHLRQRLVAIELTSFGTSQLTPSRADADERTTRTSP
jgi:hypothetical protein